MLSIVIPTLNERENVRRLIPEVFSVLEKNRMEGEVIVSDDDSPDGTGQAVRELGKLFPVRVLVRKGNRGLSASVIDGWAIAEGDVVGVMDADFSHPVEAIPRMASRFPECDMVVASRHVSGGGIEDWPLRRRVMSRAARLLARGLTNLSDPMSGFFMVKRDCVDLGRLSPIGYKILLEVMVKCPPKRIVEVPIVFRNRLYGESKLGGKVMWQYLRHVFRLYRWSSIGARRTEPRT